MSTPPEGAGPVVAGPRRISVGELTAELNDLVTEVYDDVEVIGEINAFKVHTSGHWYFSLKDENAVLACAMWKGQNVRMKRQPREGERLVARGTIEVYAARGTYSLVVRQLTAIGVGDLARRLAELKARLDAEGLFAPDRKRPLPQYPRAIGIATSQSSAALQDMLRVIRERHPTIPIYIAHCQVQGEGAAEDVARAVRRLEADGRADVILVGRGGGSAEDLFCFNEEAVVRAVAACRIPTISCVGHQTDWSLCDLAADVRAATPSHAAELATPVLGDLLATLHDREERLFVAMEARVERLRDRLARVRLIHPRQRVDQGRLRLDDLEERLHVAMRARQVRARERLVRVRLSVPAQRVQVARTRVVQVDARLVEALTRRQVEGRRAVASLTARLEALSPLAVLTRGYAIARHEGKPVLDAAALHPGDTLEVRLARGSVQARVEAIASS